jgi:hypothetical protein
LSFTSPREAASKSGDSKKIAWPKDADSAPRVQDQKVFVAGDNDVPASGDPQLQVFVVLRVSAVLNPNFGLYPDCGGREEPKDLYATVLRNRPGKLRPPKDFLNFVEGSAAKHEGVALPSHQKCATRYAVSLQCNRTVEASKITSNQPWRRSAL